MTMLKIVGISIIIILLTASILLNIFNIKTINYQDEFYEKAIENTENYYQTLLKIDKSYSIENYDGITNGVYLIEGETIIVFLKNRTRSSEIKTFYHEFCHSIGQDLKEIGLWQEYKKIYENSDDKFESEIYEEWEFLREDFARQCLNWFYYGEVEDKIRNQFFEDNIIIN